jgi:CPA1 family monovalent cation:H+ antiporter
MTSLILVMVCAIAAGWLANRIHIPYPIVLVLAGIGLGSVYDWPGLQFEPHLILAIVLPAVLYPAALDTSWRDFRANLRPILLLAIGLWPRRPGPRRGASGWCPRPWRGVAGRHRSPRIYRRDSVLRRFRLPRRIVTIWRAV